MASERTEELIQVLKQKGFPDDFCEKVAYEYLNTDYTATRMLGYLYRLENPTIELVVDEMLAILEDRKRLVKKHESEQAQAAISEFYRSRKV